MTVSARGSRAAARGRIDRRQVLEKSLAILDAEGLEALSLRRLGGDLGIDPMSIYKRVESKDALLDGVAELLHEEICQPSPDADWADCLRGYARSFRAVLHRHPNAAPVMTRNPLSMPALRIGEAYLRLLCEAGFEERRAAQIIRVVSAYANGYAQTELIACGADAQLDARPTSAAELLLRLGRMLPADVPAQMISATATLYANSDVDADFELGLELVVRGLEGLLEAEHQRVATGDGPPTA